GLDAAAQRTQHLQRHVRRHFDRALGIREGVRCERRLPEEARVNRRAILRQWRAAVGPEAAEVSRQYLIAIAVLIALTAGAGAAEIDAQHHRIAGRESRDAASDALDDPGAFVSEHDRLGSSIPSVNVDVGVADTARDQAHQDLASARLLYIERLDGRRARSGARNGGLDFHAVYRPKVRADSGTHIPWNVDRTRTGMRSRATGPSSIRRASRMARSLWFAANRFTSASRYPSASAAPGPTTKLGSCTPQPS